MVSRLYLKLWLFMTALFSFSILAHAGGGGTYLGNGGVAVVCFKIPLEQAMRGDQMTDAGRAAIQSALPIELFLAKDSAGPDSLLAQLQGLDFIWGVMKLHSQFEAYPELYTELMKQSIARGYLYEGAMVPAALKSSSDALNVFYPPEGCAMVQAVTATDALYLVQRDIWEHLTPVGQMILQLHEDLYAVERAQGKSTSVNVSLFLTQLLMSGNTKYDVRILADRYGLLSD